MRRSARCCYAATKSEELKQREDALAENEIEIKRRRKSADVALRHAKREQAEAENKNRVAAERASSAISLNGKPIGVIVDMAISALMKWVRRRNDKLADEVGVELSGSSYQDTILVDMLDQDIGGGFGTDARTQTHNEALPDIGFGTL